MQDTETAHTEAPPSSVSEHIAVGAGSVIDRYVVLDELGAGGVGIVLEAYDPELSRHVAVKLLQVRHTSETAHQLLRREARAIAKLNHPNVVSVYDVGTFKDELYIAMELVRGASLREWMRRKPRPWREVVPVFVQAGRGLAAAHEVGIVHRDFKPGNAILGDDGRVRVLDFGLARVFEEVDTDDEDLPSSDPGLLSETMTQTRGVAGTPAYMSPEQFSGATPDARSDVFSFCVSLYEGLAGHRPFAGESVRELQTKVAAGDVLPFPDGVAVPGWLRALINRGLSVDPKDRFASMGELLNELDSDRKRSLVVPGLVVAAVVGAAAVALLLGGPKASEQVQLCTAGHDRVSKVWNGGQEAKIRTAFRATKLNFADKASGEAIDRLGEYARRLSQTYDTSCHQTHLEGTVSSEMLDKRTWCLDGHVNALGTVVDLLGAEANRSSVVRATRLISRLPNVSECSDLSRLSGEARPTAKQAPALVGVRERFARAQGLVWSIQHEKALVQLKKLAKESENIGYKPMEAEVYLAMGRAYTGLNKFADARTALFRSVSLASTAGLDHTVTRGYLTWAEVAAKQNKLSPELLKTIVHVATAAAKRSGFSHRDQVLLFGVRSLMARKAVKLEEAIALARKGELIARVQRDDVSLTTMLHIELTLAAAILAAGKFDKAVIQLERLIPIARQVLGNRHPTTGALYRNLAISYYRHGETGKSREANERAHAIFTDAFGAAHPSTLGTMEWGANLAQDENRHSDAVSMLRRVVALRIKANGSAHEDVAVGLGNLSNALRGAKRFDEALVEMLKAIAIIDKLGGEKHRRHSDLLLNLGSVYQDLKRYDDAISTFKRAISGIETRLGKDHVDLVYTAIGIANVLIDAGRPAEAIPYIKRGLPISKKSQPAHGDLLRIHLGRALFLSGKNKVGGLQMVVASAALLATRGAAAAVDAKKYQDWAAKMTRRK